MRKTVNFLFEAGMLAKIPSAGLPFLGYERNRSLADHSYRSTVISFALTKLINKPIDAYKTLCLSLFYSFHKARTGDFNNVQKTYDSWNESHLWEDTKDLSPLGDEVESFWKEIQEKKTIEAQIAHDSSLLELLLFLKEQMDLGNPRASEWFDNAAKNLSLEESKQLSKELSNTPSDEWWRLRKKNKP